jgi:hypothetical protein
MYLKAQTKNNTTFTKPHTTQQYLVEASQEHTYACLLLSSFH